LEEKHTVYRINENDLYPERLANTKSQGKTAAISLGFAILAGLLSDPVVTLLILVVTGVIVFAAFQFLIAPWVIEGFLDISWVQDSPELPAVNREFIERLCAERGLPVPRIGIIYSGTPNAFCFGRVRRDARLVITSGLLDTLTPDEANSVIAHELGHIEHRDFILMTIASLAPLLLYHLYVLAEKVSDARAVA
jgi:Zn-dependent protease with chaperone function